MRKIIILLFLFFLFSSSYSQSSRKGFKLLEKLVYDKAKSAFDELREADNQNPASNFGLALIYSDEKSPYFNLIQAWYHCRILQENMDKLLQDDLEIISEYFMNTEQRPSARPVKKKIEYAVGVVEAHLIKFIREENNLALTYEVIEKFPDFRYYGNVIHIRNQLEFRKYEKQNILEGYQEFIDKFPDAAQIDKAIQYRNKCAFEKTCNINTLEAYKQYIREYPDAAEYNLAVKNLNAAAFNRAKAINTVQSYEEYIQNFPGALEVSEAKLLQKQLLYEYARKIKTLEAYDEFIRKYPEGQQYIDIFNLKSLDLGMKYLSSSSITLSNVLWTRSFDLGGETEETGTIKALENNHYFLAVTSRKNDTSHTDIWMLYLNNEGKMIWNKTAGGIFDDQVVYSAVNHKNEIILAGYTWVGTDTAACEAWLLKQGHDGKNIWSQKLGKWTINSLITDNNNNILLGGYQLNDSLAKNYRILVLNDMGRKLWNRTYSGFGEIRYMEIMPDQTILVVANNWIYKMDSKGYIKWEFNPSPDDLYCSGLISENGEFFLSGIRNDNKLFIIKVGTDGKKKWDKLYTLPDSLSSIVKMIAVEPNKTLLLSTYKNTGNGAILINNLTGELLKNVRIENGILNDVILDNEKNLLFLIENKNTILIKNSGINL